MNRTDRFSPATSHKSRYFVLTADFIIPVLIILLVIASLLFITRGRLFAIKTVDCLRDYQPCTDNHLLTELDKLKGANLFTFNKSELRTRILENNKTIENVEVTSSLPNKVSVNLISSSPSVALQLKDNSTVWVVLDQEFRVIAVRESDPNVPTVKVSTMEEISIGNPITSKETQGALEVALSIKNNFIQAETISLTDDVITLDLTEGKTALLSSKADIAEQLITLQAILADDTISESASLIDVRYTQPVIKSD